MENACSTFHQTVMELNFEWIIRELDFLPQKNGECFYSPTFYAKTNDKIRWRLRVYPKGENNTVANYLSVFLDRVIDKDNPPVIVKFKIVTLSRNNKGIVFPPTEVLKELGPAPLDNIWGWPKFVALDAIKRGSLHSTGPDEFKIVIQLVYTI